MPVSVHPDLKRLIGDGKASGDYSVASVREDDQLMAELGGELIEMHKVERISVSGSSGKPKIRLFKPTPIERGPLIVWIPGGGFVISPENYEAPFRRLAQASGATVATVEYRLSPENPFPAAFQDASEAVFRLANGTLDVGHSVSAIHLGGDSSGGNLAVAAFLDQAPRERDCIQSMSLVYPMLDATASLPAYQQFGEGYGFTREKALWYFDQYLPSEIDRKNQFVSPYWAETLPPFPPTFIATAEYDPLRDDGEMFGERLRSVGARVNVKRYHGMIHGFFQMGGLIKEAQELIQDCCNFAFNYNDV